MELNQWLSVEGDFAPSHRGHWAISENTLGFHKWIESRGAMKPPTMHRTALHKKIKSAKNVNSAKIEES